jgi:hypothetical protein
LLTGFISFRYTNSPDRIHCFITNHLQTAVLFVWDLWWYSAR